MTGNQYPNLYENLKLTCNATGPVRPPEAIDWFYEGHIIYENDERWENRIVIMNYLPELYGRSLISNLILERVTFKDSGTYVCRSSSTNWNEEIEATRIVIEVLGGGYLP